MQLRKVHAIHKNGFRIDANPPLTVKHQFRLTLSFKRLRLLRNANTLQLICKLKHQQYDVSSHPGNYLLKENHLVHGKVGKLVIVKVCNAFSFLEGRNSKTFETTNVIKCHYYPPISVNKRPHTAEERLPSSMLPMLLAIRLLESMLQIL